MAHILIGYWFKSLDHGPTKSSLQGESVRFIKDWANADRVTPQVLQGNPETDVFHSDGAEDRQGAISDDWRICGGSRTDSLEVGVKLVTSSGTPLIALHDSCRKYNGPVDEIEKGFAGPMEQHLLKNWPKIMMTDAMTPDERKIIDQWIGNMLKTPVGSWFQYPGESRRTIGDVQLLTMPLEIVDPVQLNLPDYFSM